MDGTGFDASRRIPRNIEDTDLFIAGYTPKDALIVIIPAMLLYTISKNIPIIGQFKIVFLLLGGLLGALALYLSPEYRTTSAWLETFVHQFRTPDTIEHVPYEADMARSQKPMTETKIYEMNTRSQEVPSVKRVHKHAHAVERHDGVVAGAVKVEPANLALAAPARWDRMTNDWESFLNNSVRFPIQIYATSSPFPVDRYMEQYERRMNDPDIEDRPILRELLRDFLDWYPAYLTWKGTNQRDYYVLCTVGPDEVYSTRDDGIIDQLANLPVVGGIVQQFADTASNQTEAEKRIAQLEELNRRLSIIERQGIQSLDGCSARRLTGTEYAVLLREYWNGVEMDTTDENLLREFGAVQGGGDPVEPEEVMRGSGHESEGQTTEAE